MAETYTPTTSQIRIAYVYVEELREPLYRSREEAFDRWLAEHDRDVAASALESAADTVGPRLAGAGWLRELATEIRKEGNHG